MENSRIPGEHFFTTSDNTALFYRHWPALQPGAKKVIVLFHRGHEHSGRLQHIVDELANEPAVSDILLRDYSELNVAQGQEMIAQRGMSGRVRFEQGDAFNPEELSALTPRPTLAIVSGLYELFPGNEQVKNSLAGLANAIEPGGILLYTGQPWHPQLELIAGVLTSHKDGKPWVMRVRSQGEMDSLVRDAGFDKCTQRIDEWGIFTVSMAVRRDN